MVQYYTLEEASKILQTPPERLKEMARKNELRAFQDRGTLRFRAQEVDEMARSRGLGSDPELQLGEAPPTQRGKGPASRKTATAPASGALPVDEEDVLLGGESGPKTGPPSSGKRSGGSSRSGARKKAPPGGASDSDVRLVPEGSDVDLELAGGPPKSGKGGPALPTTSPFELSEDDINLAPASGKAQGTGKSSRKLTDDALPLLPDEDEVTLGDLGGSGHASSGINLREPVDSGISLEQGGSDELEFDLSLEPGSSPKTPRPGELPESSSEFELSLSDEPKEQAQDSSSSEFELSLDEGGESGEHAASDSDSEFELTLDESGGLTPGEEGAEGEEKDIFESDFEEEALDQESGAEEAPADEEGSSEFELDLDGGGEEAGEEGGEELDLDEEQADTEAPTVARPRVRGGAAAGEEGEEGDESVGDLEQDLDEDELAPEPVMAAAPPAEWGPVPAIGLLLALPVLIIVGMMSYELVQGTTAYHKPGKLTGPVINSIARMFDDTLPKD